MNHYVADTHALFWYLINSPRLGAQASAAFDEGARGQAVIYVPAIVLAELYYSTKNSNGHLISGPNMRACKLAVSLFSFPLLLKMSSILMPPSVFLKCTTGLLSAQRSGWARLASQLISPLPPAN